MRLEKRRARVSGGELAYADEGEGHAVLLIHGFPTSSHLWRDLVPVLAPRARTIAVDLLGYGDSEKPRDPAGLTVRAQAGYVRELIDALGLDRPAAVGHDIGGGVAQLLALDGVTSTVVLADTITFDAWPIQAVRMLQEVSEDQADQELVKGVVGLALDTGLARGERLSDEDRAEYLRPWLDEPASLVRAARGIDGVGLAGTEERLAQRDVRALILWGEEDAFLPPEGAERLGEAMPGATVALLPGCGHFVTEDAPEVVLPLIADYVRHHHLGLPHDHRPTVTPVELGISLGRPREPSEPEE
jgi:2-hydroxymuconate-semialdehyde hydrolase